MVCWTRWRARPGKRKRRGPEPVSEFSLIERYFRQCGTGRADVVLGVGDDAAIVDISSGKLVVCADTLVEGVHFPAGADAADIGYKSLAVNLSDFAAMGASPKWATLALTMTQENDHWLQGFSQGFCALAADTGIALVGGDTTRGPLTVSVQLIGESGAGWLTRSGALAEQRIYVSGSLGDAALGLQCLQKEYVPGSEDHDYLLSRLARPQPRLALGAALLPWASAAIDISDGLVSDLGHLLQASDVGAVIDVRKLPLSPAYQRYLEHGGNRDFALSFGDDYELCFTAPAGHHQQILALAADMKLTISAIGWTTQDTGLRLDGEHGAEYASPVCGYRHF